MICTMSTVLHCWPVLACFIAFAWKHSAFVTAERIEVNLVQMGYNLLYGLWKYAWDADCELFLRILQGEMKEEVYYQQIQLQVCQPEPKNTRKHWY